MDAIELLLRRNSSAKLTEPAPTEEALQTMLAAASRAPDHGWIRPWRFLSVRGDARLQLGELFAADVVYGVVENIVPHNVQLQIHVVERRREHPARQRVVSSHQPRDGPADKPTWQDNSQNVRASQQPTKAM